MSTVQIDGQGLANTGQLFYFNGQDKTDSYTLSVNGMTVQNIESTVTSGTVYYLSMFAAVDSSGSQYTDLTGVNGGVYYLTNSASVVVS